MMLASTVQEPVQLSWHSVVQSVEPGWAMQACAHCVSQLAEQSGAQLGPLQPLVHPDWQSVEQ
jgi:hypothetical protein